MQLSEHRDMRRMAAAVFAAVLVHAGLFVAIPYLTSLDTAPLPDYGPVVVRVEMPEAVIEPPPPVAVPEPQPAPVAKPAPAPKPAAKAAPAAKATPTAPTAAAPAVTTRAAGSAFRQAGAAAGVSTGAAEASVTTGPPPITLPAVGTTTPGAGEQRSGVGESLTARPTGGALDTGKLDKSLAGAATGGATGAAGPGGAAAATGTKPGPGSNIVWEDPAAAGDRGYVTKPKVVPPTSAIDFVYEVRVSFVVNAAGLVTSAKVTQGSGRTDVDNACVVAMKKAKFTSAPGSPDIKGMQLFTPDFGRLVRRLRPLSPPRGPRSR